MTTTINFNDLARGTVVDNEYTSQGVTVSALGGSGKAMVFDTFKPTGGDTDLATNNLGNVLIISEDGNSQNPDDEAHGGTLRFNFHEAADVKSLTFLDIEESATVKFYDEQGVLIATQHVGPTGDNGQVVAHFNVEGAYRMDVILNGSGAIDNLVFEDSGPDLDGTVEGTDGNDVIDVAYTGDPQGDRVDANDQILPGEGIDDDIIVAKGGDDVVRAGNGNDDVFGGSGNDSIDGGAGNDKLFGGTGDDVILGGAGNDKIEASAGNDSIDGGTGDDDLWGGLGNDTIRGGEGNDSIDAGQGDDMVFAGNGDDVINAGAGNDKVEASAGNDVIDGGDGDDDLWGGLGDDTITSGAGADIVRGGNDADVIFGSAGDTIDGGAGGNDHDTLDLTGQGPFFLDNVVTDGNGNGINGTVVFVNADGTPNGQTIHFTEIERVIGDEVNRGPDATDNSYTFLPGEAAGDVDGNVLTDDTGNGADSDPDGDALAVVAVGGAAAGVGAAVAGNNGGLFTINADGTVDFDANGDFEGLGLGETAETSITYTISDGNGGTDTATVTFAVEGVNDGTIQGTNGNDLIIPGFVDADGDIVDGNDNILPGKGPNDDVILAGPGNDSVLAGVGDDTVFGGIGNDNIDGGMGDDLLLGGAGNDTVAGGQGDDRIFGADGDDTLEGGSGNDVLEGSAGDDFLSGGTGDDDLWGGLDNDVVIGGDGNDTVAGEAGDDSLHGGFGDDQLFGGDGDDELFDRDGSDSAFGGAGDDIIIVGNEQDDALPDVGYPEQTSTINPGLTIPGYAADTDPNDDKDFVDGGAGNDVISTGDDDDSIIGGTGDDTINAGFDDDTVDGGAGNDVIEGSEGNDVIKGGDGDDVIFGGLADPEADIANLPDDEPNEFGFQDLVPENNGDTIFGGAGNDIIFGQDDDDSLFGGTGNDFIDGGVDDDLIDGGAGDDELIGGQGDDSILGGAGSDIITGGVGNDLLAGGTGSDTFLGGNGGDNVVGGEDADGNDIDVLDLTGSNVDFITYNDGDPESGVVTFLDGTTMTFAEIENVIPCFTPGTTIATPKGERLVEELQVGDRIITRDNGIQEIAWVGHKSMDGKQLAANPHLKPILIKAGSLGDGLPERDMLVSPNHRVLVASEMTQLYFEEREVLASAKHMTGAQGIHAVDVMSTTYIHFMFEKHEVVLSNGAWTESFQPGDYSLKGIGNSQRNEIFELFPELATKGGLKDYQSARKALKKHETKLLMK